MNATVMQTELHRTSTHPSNRSLYNPQQPGLQFPTIPDYNNAADERQVQIRLTDQGRALQPQTHHIPECVHEKSGLTIAAIITLQNQITSLRDHLRQP